ncbi:MAG: response regulator transcription factor [Verrucomicrobiae bacterium]|nr:response regulator transcription factor [Verrucomicrobiae bacterium]
MKLLVIEDSERLRRSLGHGLKKAGYAVDLVGDGQEGLDYARFNDYGVIILDLMLPGIHGLEVLQRLRKIGKDSHILILSAMDRIEDRVKGLELGADDYMVKPFAFEELCARIATLIRRRHDEKSPVIEIGSIRLNTAAKSVEAGGGALALTPAEYSVFEALALQRGMVISKEKLLQEIHDSDSFAGTNVVEVLVCHLRKKLAAAGARGILHTRRGYGYVIEP